MEDDHANWRHAICRDCWAKRNPGQKPVSLLAPDHEICCYCKQPTTSGLYVRDDPKVVHP